MTLAGFPPSRTLVAGTSATYVFRVRNVGTAQSFSFTASDDKGFAVSAAGTRMIGTNVTIDVPVTLDVPANAIPGSSDTLTFTATGASSSTSKFAVVTSFVVAPAAAPAFTSVTPNRGPTAGGTNVTIRGADFEPGVIVLFGGTLASNIVRVDATTITAVTPPHAAATVDVTIRNPDDQQVVAPNAFTFSADEGAAIPTLGPVALLLLLCCTALVAVHSLRNGG
jgi:hypothetical protein